MLDYRMTVLFPHGTFYLNSKDLDSGRIQVRDKVEFVRRRNAPPNKNWLAEVDKTRECFVHEEQRNATAQMLGWRVPIFQVRSTYLRFWPLAEFRLEPSDTRWRSVVFGRPKGLVII